MTAGLLLRDIANQIRSKNAGPFWLTIDIFLQDTDTFTRVSRSRVTDPQVIAVLYGVDPTHVKIFELADLCAIKISFPRPVVQGSLYDRDMHGGQQYVPLLALSVD
jgi:hypothetical protein